MVRKLELNNFLLVFFIYFFPCLKEGKSQYVYKPDDTSYLANLIFVQYCDSFPEIYEEPEKFQLQIIFVRINRDSLQKPHFSRHTLGVNRYHYFYPASLIKLPVILLSLEKLQTLKKYGVNKYTCLKIGKVSSCQTKLTDDSTSLDGCPTIADFIRKILLVSDNISYNRLYEFLGQQYIHQQLRKKGYKDVYILKRFSSACSVEENRLTNPFWFYNKHNQILYYQPPQTNTQILYVPYNIQTQIGKGYLKGKVLEEKPFDFRYSSFLPLEDALEMIQSIFFPESLPPRKRWNISEEDRAFLIRYLAMYPRQSKYKIYKNYEKYEDSYKKYFCIGDSKDTIQDNGLKIFNIVGLSYGFVMDVAYIVHLEKKIEFLVAAVIYTNANDILNDDQYEYHQIAFPFFGKLGRILLQEEEKRIKNVLPNFSELEKILQDTVQSHN
ncbi:MAG: class A beta-lactamase-related serine hydrolase [Bacteroidales bacterium]|nr:class A beta-lactamase-related serine hydrolase [Bacteroidales bacterium]